MMASFLEDEVLFKLQNEVIICICLFTYMYIQQVFNVCIYLNYQYLQLSQAFKKTWRMSRC